MQAVNEYLGNDNHYVERNKGETDPDTTDENVYPVLGRLKVRLIFDSSSLISYPQCTFPPLQEQSRNAYKI